MERITIKASDRALLALVAEATFANPFGQRRQALDREILGLTRTARGPSMVPRVIERVKQKLMVLDQTGVKRIQDFAEEDQVVLRTVFLFDIFHECLDRFDAFIARQVEQGSHSLEVTFAHETIQQLTLRGFTQELACRFFSLFYQVRRAFYFIDKGLLGECPCMRQLRENLWNHIFTSDIRLYETSLWNRMEDFSTLLTGPTGSGKGAAAAAIGRSGFIPFDTKKGRFAAGFADT
ncbi:MAG: sigma-54-dependent Fis family transcriptional regulator, partial [Planctomycetes bacterium]|nr:sigma-54-dependent Fis family transcriptional regulator [Planctomycetota bacterium]